MDIAHKLAQFNADPALAAWVMEQLQTARNTVKTKVSVQRPHLELIDQLN